MNILESDEIAPSTLYYGDCLEVMREWTDVQVDLICLDPPFNSKSDYNVVFGSASEKRRAQFMAFEDTWQWDGSAVARVEAMKKTVAGGMDRTFRGLEQVLGPSGMLAYLSYMAERLVHCHRLLRRTGSIFLHCDPSASHYLKVLMDGIFGADGFRNEIAWHYSGWNRKLRSHLERRHDVILFYARSDRQRFRYPTRPWKDKEEYLRVRRQKLRETKDGREYVLSDAGGGKRIRRYIDEAMEYGVPVDDVWEIPKLNNSDREHMGYPTQKPLALLRRIIEMSSEEGDLVLDPFCGSGAAVVVANELGRRWAGIDISPFAVDHVMRERLDKVGIPARREGVPTDLEAAGMLAKRNWRAFGTWAIAQVPGLLPNETKAGDGGIDGCGGVADVRDGGDLVIAH